MPFGRTFPYIHAKPNLLEDEDYDEDEDEMSWDLARDGPSSARDTARQTKERREFPGLAKRVWSFGSLALPNATAAVPRK